MIVNEAKGETKSQDSFWKDVEAKRKQKEDAVLKQAEQIHELQMQIEKLRHDSEIQKRNEAAGRVQEAEKYQEQMRALQSEKDKLASELAKRELELQKKNAEKEKQAEAAKYQEKMRALQVENDRLAVELANRELEMQKKRAEEEREAEFHRLKEQMRTLQIEKDKLATEVARRKKEEDRPHVSKKTEQHQFSYSQSDYESLKKTVYGHANCEPKEAQMGVAFVVVNRAKANKDYWGGTSINEVCRKPGQFWFGIFGEPQINDWNMYNSIDEWLPRVLKGEIHDLTNGANHFLPHWETHHDWLSNVRHVASHGNFKFFKAKWLP